uniref:Uncharacterized protein n=1 Tax=Chenopodium quinoa TaxID=63459 RepID=A0A803N6D0_CHEQI
MVYESAIELSMDLLGDMKTIGVPKSRHCGRLDGKGTIGRRDRDLTREKWRMAHTYILHNEDEVAPYVERHMSFLRRLIRKANPKAIAAEHNKSFGIWFQNEVMKEF